MVALTLVTERMTEWRHLQPSRHATGDGRSAFVPSRQTLMPGNSVRPAWNIQSSANPASGGELSALPEDRLRMWPVSRRVNKTGTGDDDPTLVDEVAA